MALSLVWSNKETEIQKDKVICQEKSIGLLPPCLTRSPVSRGQLKMHKVHSPIPLAWYVLVCRITVPNTLEGLKQTWPSSRTYSTSSWVAVKQSTLCEAHMVTNRALDVAAHQLHIVVVFCCVGSTHSKLVMSLSSFHVILCEFLICNAIQNTYIYWPIALLAHEY